MAPNEYAFIFALLLFTVFAGIGVWSAIEWRNKEHQRLHAEQNQESARASLAHKHGWHYAYPPDDDVKYRFRGVTAGGVAWTLHFDLDAASSTSAPKLVFVAGSLRTEKLSVLIGDAQSYDAITSSTGKKAMSVARSFLDGLSGGKLGAMADFYQTAQVQRVGDWVVASRGLQALQVQQLLSLTTLLSHWPNQQGGGSVFHPPKHIELTRGNEGVTITLRTDNPSVEVIDHLAAVGLRVIVILK